MTCPSDRTWRRIPVDFMYYGEDGLNIYALIQCVNHESDRNLMQHTTVISKIKLVKREQGKVPGGTWQNVSQRLMEVLGNHRRKWVTTAVSLARDLPTELHAQLEISKNVSMSHLLNKYLTGSEDARKKLSAERAVRAVQVLDEQRALNNIINSSEFEQKVCLPLKQVGRRIE